MHGALNNEHGEHGVNGSFDAALARQVPSRLTTGESSRNDELHLPSTGSATADTAGSRMGSFSFKRRPRDVSTGLSSMRRWLGRESYRNSSTFSARYWGSGMPEGWEHPARYLNASQITVPSILPAVQPVPQSTPIPMLPYTVLCLLIFGEFSSSGVAGPFLFFMLNDFQLGDESRVGFWAGILSSIFFFAQFLTSLMWSSVADKHGRKYVLQMSLIGNSLSLIAFGLAPNLQLAILFRLAQGFFNGAVGVARGAVRSLTDETNEGRAYAQMGFWWGMGGIVGPILGGVLEHPAIKFPWLFGRSAFLHAHPYALPCMFAASSTILGAILSFFLESDAPTATGRIRLTSDHEVGHEHEHETDPNRSAWSLASSTWSRSRRSHHWPQAFGPRTRPISSGSAYGYQGEPARAHRESMLRRMSVVSSAAHPSSYFAVPHDAGYHDEPNAEHDHENANPRASLVERFVLANDDTVLSITDLWVAAAANTEDVPEDDDRNTIAEADEVEEEDDEGQHHSNAEHSAPADLPTTSSNETRPTSTLSSTYVPPMHFARSNMLHRMNGHDTSATDRRPSSTVNAAEADEDVNGHAQTGALDSVDSTTADVSAPNVSPSPIWLLPLVVIGHYGVLSFHSSMFDQVFMAFLVTPEPSGGLGLTASHYAGLIAAMTFCQLLFQFQVYPNFGPPYGSLSHLAVLQWGVLLYLPCYVLFPFLRTFLLPNTDVAVMLGMILFAAIRWLANILSFTAVMVLLNAWTPAHLVPLANGLAQTMSSFARCVGPIIGGIIWAKSIEGGPNAHAWPFNFHFGFWVVGLVALAGAIHTRWMRDVIMIS